MSDDIFGIVVTSIAEIKKIAPDSIRMDSTFEELRMDSLDGLELFFQLEDAFNLTIPDERARSLRSVRDIVDAVEKLLSEQSSDSPAKT